MTDLLEPTVDEPFRRDTDVEREAPPPAEPTVDEGPLSVPLRPFMVAALSSVAAAMMAGGIFGSLLARLVCAGGALLGVGWCLIAQRSPTRRSLLQGLFPVVLLGVALLSVVGASANLPHLVSRAVQSGNLLRPPIPFDPGWRPILLVLMALIGFSAASIAQERPQLALLLPAPVLALTAITQPKAGQFVSALATVIPFIGAVTVLFGGNLRDAAGLSRQFEARRVIRAFVALVPIVGLLIVANSTSIMFPKPVYDPSQKPQKPKAVPLSQVQDRVLFQVDGPITGPWKLGSLDVYDGKSWKLPPYSPKKLQRIQRDGTIDKHRAGNVTVTFTIGDLGTSATLPGVVGPASVTAVTPSQKLLFDPRSGTLRVASGRVPSGLVYKLALPKYPSALDLRAQPPLITPPDGNLQSMPLPPPSVAGLLAQAPSDPWDRMNFLLQKLNAVEVAVGAGTPIDVPPSTVERILAGNHEGSPYELVAAQAMLARWAGIPSRIGFGFDGNQKEGAVFTVRPKNAAQWLEVYFQDAGWIPIITAPPRAKESLNTDKNSRFNPTIQAGSDVAIEIYVPVKVKNLRLLYQQVRSVLFSLLPIFVLLLGGYFATPWAKKAWRRSKRRRWAAGLGAGQSAAAMISVEYAEFRDLATDLGVGNPYDTPLEFLDEVAEDDEHEELAWLVSKCLYGDLAGLATTTDVQAARELGASLSRRLKAAQPLQTRVLAFLTRASLISPFTLEVPNVSVVRLPRVRLRSGRRRRDRENWSVDA